MAIGRLRTIIQRVPQLRFALMATPLAQFANSRSLFQFVCRLFAEAHCTAQVRAGEQQFRRRATQHANSHASKSQESESVTRETNAKNSRNLSGHLYTVAPRSQRLLPQL